MNNMTRGHASRRARSSRGYEPSTRVTVAPVFTRQPDPRVWEYALKLANDDPNRLSVQPDGAVIVHNSRVR